MPKNLQVVDIKPKTDLIINAKPKNDATRTEFTNQLYEQVLTAGMYMGIPPHTYPSAGTVQSPLSY